MKRIFGLLLVLGTCGSAAYAQSTMPAMGANTPKGEVAKTDASINPVSPAKRTNASSKSANGTDKKMRKNKDMKSKTMTTNPM